MSKLLCYSLFRHLLHHPWQLFSSLSGITLGVAVVLAVDLANSSAYQSFQFATQQLSGSASHRLTSSTGTIPEEIYVRLKKESGLSKIITPIVTGYVRLSSQPDQSFRLLGIDPLSGIAFRSKLASNDAIGLNPITLLEHPHGAIIPAGMAVDSQDQTLTVITETGSFRLIKVGEQSAESSLNNLLITDISTAQAVLNLAGKLSYIDIFLTKKNNNDHALINTITRQLPDGMILEQISDINQALSELSSAFRLNLTALSLLALLVGMFLVYNAMSFAVVQRRELLGILRAIGVSRNEIFAIILSEALILGIIGLILGSLLGILLGSHLVDLVTRTINDLYYSLPVTIFSIDSFSVIKIIVLGIFTTLAATWLPAYEASKVVPRAAMNRAFLEQRWRLSLLWLNLAGFSIGITGLLILWFSSSLWAGFSGLFLIILGLTLLTPWILVKIIHLSENLTSHLILHMALRGISRHLSRTGIALAALVVAFSATVGIGIMVDSFRTGVISWLQQQLTADLYISSPSSGNRSQFLKTETLKYLQTIPEITELSTYYWSNIKLSGKPAKLVAVDLSPAARSGYRLLKGDPQQVWKTFADEDNVIVSEPLAYKHQLTLGDTLNLNTPSGVKTFSIIGVFHDYSSEHGRILMHSDIYQRYWHDQGVTSAALFVKAEQNLEELKNKIEQHTQTIQNITIRFNQDIFNRSLAVFDRTFLITHVLRLLALAIAFAGILSALMALQLERRREFATLNALGMTSTQIAYLTYLQTGIMGFWAGLLAVPMGLILASLLIFVINKRAFGWTLPFQVNPEILYQCVSLAVLGALLAGVYPVWQQCRINPAQALRSN